MSDLSRVIESVGKDRGIKREIIISALEQAVMMAAQKRLGPTAVLEAHYNQETGAIEVFQLKRVVAGDEVTEENLQTHISIDEARMDNPDVEMGDEVGIEIDSSLFGRIDAQTAKQVIFQKVRDAEREIIYNEFVHRKGELITGIARRVERGSLVIDLGKTDALLPRNEIIPGEVFKPGDRVQAYLSEVGLTHRGPQLFLSRTSPAYLIKLFEIEVPEIREGIVEIKHCVREPGARAKIAVISKDRDVDPAGACIGMKGNRVLNVVQELKGEKIDIVIWSDNPVIFVRSALKPAEISSVRMDERAKTMEIMVEDDQLSVAIGRKGQNVRLAAQLTGWRLDIISKSKLQKRQSEAIFNLQHMEGINETLATAMYQAGFLNVRQVSNAQPEALMKVPGFESIESATQLKEKAMKVVETAGDLLAPSENEAPPMMKSGEQGTYSAPATPQDAKALAEARLREMMRQAGDKS